MPMQRLRMYQVDTLSLSIGCRNKVRQLLSVLLCCWSNGLFCSSLSAVFQAFLPFSSPHLLRSAGRPGNNTAACIQNLAEDDPDTRASVIFC
ncbi:unnamed protein product [Protopolystoma xenopodis]|uniref:Uncharacterized protein n=1 Tax=Protopolystoma xenopodis TaxID=117903 RepID=A0A3S5CTP8_9PLAT|nr:unnamed protein product [Protopolystoma xenopodis]